VKAPVIFLALLIPALAGQLAAAENQPGAEYALVIDVYSGVVGSDATQEMGFRSGLERLNEGKESTGDWLPKVIHIEHLLPDKDFDVAEQADANGQKVVVQGHVSRQADGNFNIVFSQLGRPPAYSGATELTLALDDRRILHLPIIAQADNHEKLETVVVTSYNGTRPLRALTAALIGHGRRRNSDLSSFSHR
jgi:hypothetical protein